jgi:phosphatidate cytidylyltransferase
MSGLRERALTAIVLAPLAIIAVLWLGNGAFAAAIGVVFVLGLAEWARLIGLASVTSRMALVACNAALMAALWHWRSAALLHGVVLAGVAWWPLAAIWLGHFGFAADRSRLSLALKAIAGTLTVVPAWVAAVVLHQMPDRGPWWLLFVLLLIWCADICAYFAGRRFGRSKLAPRISPGKTRAGVYGALAGSVLYAGAAGIALGSPTQRLWLLVALSLVTVLFSIVGDLFESLIKRHSNVKDSGALFPGHGGVFDRFDSLFAALPVFVAGKLVLGL